MRLTSLHVAEIVGIYKANFSANYNLDDEFDLNLVAESIWHMIGRAFSIDTIKAILKSIKRVEESI